MLSWRHNPMNQPQISSKSKEQAVRNVGENLDRQVQLYDLDPSVPH